MSVEQTIKEVVKEKYGQAALRARDGAKAAAGSFPGASLAVVLSGSAPGFSARARSRASL